MSNQTTAQFEIPSKRISLSVEGRVYRDYQILAETIILHKGTPKSRKDQVILEAALQLLIQRMEEIIAQRPDCPFVHIDELLGKQAVNPAVGEVAPKSAESAE